MFFQVLVIRFSKQMHMFQFEEQQWPTELCFVFHARRGCHVFTFLAGDLACAVSFATVD